MLRICSKIYTYMCNKIMLVGKWILKDIRHILLAIAGVVLWAVTKAFDFLKTDKLQQKNSLITMILRDTTLFLFLLTSSLDQSHVHFFYPSVKRISVQTFCCWFNWVFCLTTYSWKHFNGLMKFALVKIKDQSKEFFNFWLSPLLNNIETIDDVCFSNLM